MKALGYKKAGPIEAIDALIEFETEDPVPGPRDLIVEVRGVSINPVDVKLRAAAEPDETPKILGYDGAGIVRRIGSEVRSFSVGDEVYYAGDITRPGTNAELHAVDERIVGAKPHSLDFAEAAGLPLTSITAWELLFDSLRIQEGGGKGDSILIIGGAGGVGSMLIQLTKRLTGLQVIATASRRETTDWARKMGADAVINHRESLADQLKDLDIQPRYVASLTGSAQHFSAIVDLIAPRGHIAMIDDPPSLDIGKAKSKALSFSWELMFTRPMYHTADMGKQGELLNRVATLIDNGGLQSTVTNKLGSLGVETLKKGHALQESGRVIGKNVLRGFAGS